MYISVVEHFALMVTICVLTSVGAHSRTFQAETFHSHYFYQETHTSSYTMLQANPNLYEQCHTIKIVLTVNKILKINIVPIEMY